MNIDEAIQHAEDVAKETVDCRCGKEHLQLATWLKERKELEEKLAVAEGHSDELSKKIGQLEQQLKESEFNRNFWFDKLQAQEAHSAVLVDVLKSTNGILLDSVANHLYNCECFDCGISRRAMKVLDTTPSESAAKVLKSQIHLYNLGYMAGHEDTVEGVFTSLSAREMETENEDVVKQALAEWEDTK